MSDEQITPPPDASQQTQSTPTPQPSAPEPQPPPPSNFSTQEAMAEERPANFGEQLIQKGGLPKDLKTRIEKIDKGG